MDKKLEARIARLEKIMNRRSVKNEEAYTDDDEGKLDQLFDRLLDCKDDIEALGRSNREIAKDLRKAAALVDSAMNSIGKALDYVQAL